jgi:hypothetical protein
LIRIARKLYATEPLGLELDNTAYALDSTNIDLCLTLFPWVPFRPAKGAIKDTDEDPNRPHNDNQLNLL